MILYVRARCNIFLLYSVHYEMNDTNFIFFSLLILLVDEEAKKTLLSFRFVKCREVHGRAEGSKTPKSAAGLLFLRTDVTRGVLHTHKKTKIFFSFLFSVNPVSHIPKIYRIIDKDSCRAVPLLFIISRGSLKLKKETELFFLSLLLLHLHSVLFRKKRLKSW